jgi:cell wall-associated NlpC family hydrolase
VPTLESLVTRLSVSGVAAGVVLMTVSATATTATPPPLRTAPFASVSMAVAPTVAAPPAAVATTTVPATTAPTTSAPTTAVPTSAPSPLENVIGFALAQRGRPYQHGAAGPGAYDCSGLTMMAYRAAGIDLPHYSVSQAQRGQPVDWRHQPIRAGDLVFTRGDTPVIDLGHVGLAISSSEWVVASRPGTSVRVAPIPRGAIQRVRRLLP